MLIALAGLASLPREPYEAAHLDGASPVQAFWHITLPLLRPTLVVAILFRSIDALKTFDIIFVMTQGGPANASETINILLFNQAFSYFNMGYAASMAVALFALVMGASLILIKVRRTRGVVSGSSARRRWLSTAGFYGLAAALHAADGLRLLLDDHALAEAPGRGDGLSALVRALQRHHRGLSRGVHEVSVLPLHVEQPRGGDGLHGARASRWGCPRPTRSLAGASSGWPW